MKISTMYLFFALTNLIYGIYSMVQIGYPAGSYGIIFFIIFMGMFQVNYDLENLKEKRSIWRKKRKKT